MLFRLVPKNRSQMVLIASFKVVDSGYLITKSRTIRHNVIIDGIIDKGTIVIIEIKNIGNINLLLKV